MSGPLSEVRLHLVETYDDAGEFLRWLGRERPVLGFDTETGGLQWWRDSLRLVQVGDAMDAWVFPIEGMRGWGGVVFEGLARYDRPLVAHNAKFDCHFLRRHGLALPRHRVHDTVLMAHAVDPASPRGLKALGARWVHPSALQGQAELKEAMAKHRWTWATVPLDFQPYWVYAGLDAVLTARVAERLWPLVQPYRQVYELESGVWQLLMDMEERGMRVDLPYCRRLRDEWLLRVEGLARRIRDEFGVDKPGSNAKVAARLQEDGVVLTKRTETGQLSMEEEVLQGVDHPLAALVLEHRKTQKLVRTYLDTFLADADAQGVVHPVMKQVGARTGRMSIEAPPLQTLPRASHIRDAMIPRDGHRLLVADYSNMEMRVMAHFSQDEVLLDTFARGLSAHDVSAERIFGPGFTKAQRQLTKNAGFAKIYGAGLEKFALTARMDVQAARSFLAQYDRLHGGVVRFMRELTNEVARLEREEGVGYVLTPHGRRHPVDQGKAYTAVNYLIQGWCADLFKEKMLELDAAGAGPYLVVPVHDELVFDAPEDVMGDLRALVEEVMPVMPPRISTPLTIEADEFARWGDKYREAA